MKAQIRTRMFNADAGGDDVLMLAGLLVAGYYFLTRQVVPDAFAAVKAAGGATADAANAAVNRGAQIVTGDPTTTLGSSLYDLGVRVGLNPDVGAVAVAPSLPPSLPGTDLQYDAMGNVIGSF